MARSQPSAWRRRDAWNITSGACATFETGLATHYDSPGAVSGTGTSESPPESSKQNPSVRPHHGHPSDSGGKAFRTRLPPSSETQWQASCVTWSGCASNIAWSPRAAFILCLASRDLPRRTAPSSITFTGVGGRAGRARVFRRSSREQGRLTLATSLLRATMGVPYRFVESCRESERRFHQGCYGRQVDR